LARNSALVSEPSVTPSHQQGRADTAQVNSAPQAGQNFCAGSLTIEFRSGKLALMFDRFLWDAPRT